MKLIYLILLLAGLTFGQNLSKDLFTTGALTISAATIEDTLDWVVYTGGVGLPAYTPITNYLTAVEKGAGNTLMYVIDGETGFGHGDYIQFQIRGNGATSTITSKSFYIGNLKNNKISLFITCDTTTNAAVYGGKITGN